MAGRNGRPYAAAIAAVLLSLFISLAVVSCDIQFTGGTAIQEVFEDELVNDDVSLHPTDGTTVTIRLVPDTSVPETVLVYEVLLYRTNSDTLYRTVEVDSSYTLELHDLPRASYRIVGRALTDGGVAVEVGEASFKVSSNGAYAVIELKDVGHIMEHHGKVDATCTASGIIEHWHCTRCNLDFTDKEGLNYVSDTTIPAKGHSMVHVEAKASTCIEKGTIDHWHCDRCGRDFSNEEGSNELDGVLIDALGHDWSTEWSHDEHSHWHSCTRCSATGDVADHGMAEKSRVESTDETEGEVTTECIVCGYEHVEVLPAIGHDCILVDSVQSTCTEHGYEIYKCAHDGCTYTYRKKLPLLPHSTTHMQGKPATCTEPGNEEYWYCSTCRIYYRNEACSERFDDEDKTVIPAKGHDWSTTWEKDSDSHWHTCRKCDEVEKKDHSYICKVETGEYLVSSATCTKSAVYRYSCVCGAKGAEMFESTTYPAIGHELEHVPANAATCGEAGNSEYWRCTRTNCGKLFSDANGKNETSLEEETIPATGKHVFTDDIHKTEDYESSVNGHKHICLVCKKSIGDFVAHSWTYENDSSNHWLACQICHYEKPGTHKESHKYVDGHCPVCGRYDENPASKPGFDVGEKSSEPKGEVTYTHEENNWTFIFEDKTPDKENPVRIDELFWCVDGERQSDFDGKTEFVLNTPRKQSYTVLCVYNNGKGYGSCEITVTGY